MSELENLNKAYLKLTMVIGLTNHHRLLNILGVSVIYTSAIVHFYKPEPTKIKVEEDKACSNGNVASVLWTCKNICYVRERF